MNWPRLSRTDPALAMAKMRKIAENLIKTHYTAYKHQNNPNLAQMIKELDELKIYPRTIKTYLETIRILGNIGTHEGGITALDVDIMLPMFLHTRKWLVTHSLEIIVKEIKKT